MFDVVMVKKRIAVINLFYCLCSQIFFQSLTCVTFQSSVIYIRTFADTRSKKSPIKVSDAW